MLQNQISMTIEYFLLLRSYLRYSSEYFKFYATKAEFIVFQVKSMDKDTEKNKLTKFLLLKELEVAKIIVTFVEGFYNFCKIRAGGGLAKVCLFSEIK